MSKLTEHEKNELGRVTNIKAALQVSTDIRAELTPSGDLVLYIGKKFNDEVLKWGKQPSKFRNLDVNLKDGVLTIKESP